jgi:hypothetical protein
MSCNAENLGLVKIRYLLGLLKSKKYIIYDKPYQLNIVGVRNKDTNPQKFDDSLFVFWKNDKNNWEGRKYAITTDPSTKYLTRGGIGSYQGRSATAILPSGQYIDTWKIGSHKGKYKALTQAKPICVYRDYDRNATLSFNLKDKDCGMFGINIHKAKSYGADDGNGNTNLIGDYSAGCQVFQNYYCFKEFMQLVEKQESIYRNRYFTYTLFDKWTQNKLYFKRTVFLSGLIGGLGLLGYGLYLKGKNK